MSARIEIALGERSYGVEIGADCLSLLGQRIAGITGPDRKVFAVVDEGARSHWETRALPALKGAGFDPQVRILPGGDAVKTWSELQNLCEFVLAEGAQRRDVLIGFGGGAVGDLAGLAASLIHRGMALVQCPTTLLSMVDSSVGGKTAINTARGKNMIGTFYQPTLVMADPEVLTTLSDRERACGWAEIIKIAAIRDEGLFTRLERAGPLRQLRGAGLEACIAGAVAAKAAIVAEDEREAGVRALLNFGHTFGHALETLARDKGDVRHGEAVAVGMMLATRFAIAARLCDESLSGSIARLLKSAGAPTSPLELTMFSPGAGAMLNHMMRDKKNKGAAVTLVLPTRAGSGILHTERDADALLHALESLLAPASWISSQEIDS